jgi:hypothetical protein
MTRPTDNCSADREALFRHNERSVVLQGLRNLPIRNDWPPRRLRIGLAHSAAPELRQQYGRRASRRFPCPTIISPSVRLTDLTLSCERLHARSGRAARQLPQRR